MVCVKYNTKIREQEVKRVVTNFEDKNNINVNFQLYV